jgi:hypothetical protein
MRSDGRDWRKWSGGGWWDKELGNLFPTRIRLVRPVPLDISLSGQHRHGVAEQGFGVGEMLATCPMKSILVSCPKMLSRGSFGGPGGDALRGGKEKAVSVLREVLLRLDVLLSELPHLCALICKEDAATLPCSARTRRVAMAA